MAYLETLAADEGGDRGAQLAVIDSRLQSGDVAGARDYLDDLLSETPDVLLLRFLDGIVTAAEGDLEGAISIYRGLLDEGVGGERVWVELVRALSLSGDMDGARAALAEAVAALPGSGQLLWMQASLLEQDGDFEGAIDIYERLYEADSSQPIVANNLASLLSSVRSDEESLQRAAVIARRLRGTDFPAFQDTYGWIAYRLGNYEEALQYLSPAADALPEDALVQAHLGLALAATQRRSEAEDVLTRALDLAGDDPRPAFAQARAALQELQNGDSEAASD
jgi:tetratricopeptide (TPR) repeat protein